MTTHGTFMWNELVTEKPDKRDRVHRAHPGVRGRALVVALGASR